MTDFLCSVASGIGFLVLSGFALEALAAIIVIPCVAFFVYKTAKKALKH